MGEEWGKDVQQMVVGWTRTYDHGVGDYSSCLCVARSTIWATGVGHIAFIID